MQVYKVNKNGSLIATTGVETAEGQLAVKVSDTTMPVRITKAGKQKKDYRFLYL